MFLSDKMRVSLILGKSPSVSLDYVIRFVSDLRQIGDFLRVLWFPPSIKVTEILLKVALNTITLAQSLTIGFEHRHMIHSVLTVTILQGRDYVNPLEYCHYI
jgi:hypothetical protein